MARQYSAQEIAYALSNGRPTRAGDGFLVSCIVPGHDDRNPSCMLFDKPGGGPGIKCLSGCSQDATWQALTDLGYVAKKAEKKFIDIPDAECKRDFVKQWKWLDADGNLHMTTTRLELKRPDGSVKKKIPFPKLPDGKNPGPNYPVIPLYLPEVLKAAKEGSVIVDAEGEPKADIIREWGMCGTTTGASSKKQQWEASKVWEHFNGAKLVVILDDNDIPGLEWALFKAKKLFENGIPVKLIHLPDLGARASDHGKDIKDWKLAGHTKEEFQELIEEWPLFQPEGYQEAPSSNVVQMFAKPKDYLTDTFNSKHFLQLHGDDLLFISDRGRAGRWFIWNGQRYAEDMREEVMNLVEDSNTKLEDAYANVNLNTEAKDRWLRKSLDAAGMSATERVSRKKKSMMLMEVDTDPDIINCANGLLHLPTLTLRPHTKGWKDVLMSPMAYDPKAECPEFEKHLRTWLSNEPELMQFDQRHGGYCLTGHTREQVALVKKGDGGGGKSIHLSLKVKCLGRDYSHKIPDAVFREVEGTGNASSDYHQLVLKRLGVWWEVKKGMKLDEKKLKEVTDGGLLDARANFGEVYNFQSQLKLIFNSNYPLNIPNDRSLTRRILYMPYDAIIKEQDKIEGLAEKLWAAEGPGIFKYYCEGAATWYAHGLKPPAMVRQFSDDIFSENDLPRQFADEHCRVSQNPDDAVRSNNAGLYKAFKAMALQNGFTHVISPSHFATEIERLGFNKKRWRKDEVPKFLLVRPEYMAKQHLNDFNNDGDK